MQVEFADGATEGRSNGSNRSRSKQEEEKEREGGQAPVTESGTVLSLEHSRP